MGDVPRIELFARRKSPGWAVWGNELESDIAFGKPAYHKRKNNKIEEELMTKMISGKRTAALLLVMALVFSMLPTAFAAQQNSYHDPAEHWMQASGRTNELDATAL